jgi:putative transposase
MKSRITATRCHRSSEQIIYALKRVEGGEKAAEVCRKMGVSEASFYLWKKKFSGKVIPTFSRFPLREAETLLHTV